MFQRPIRQPSDAEYLRRVEKWMNPGLEFSQEKAAEKARIARLFGGGAQANSARH